MKELIQKLFPDVNPDTVLSLYRDGARAEVGDLLGSEVELTTSVLPFERLADAFFLICIRNPFGAKGDESWQVAVFLANNATTPDPLPLVTEHQGLQLAAKTLTALALYPDAIKRRHLRRGAPDADFYRRKSQSILASRGHEILARHHENWESFLFTRLN